MTQDFSHGTVTGPDLPGVTWRTSSYTNNGGECVEVGRWTRSSYSNNGGDCVEATLADRGNDLFPHLAGRDDLVVVRDSKDPDGPVLGFAGPEWTAFLASIKSGGHDPI